MRAHEVFYEDRRSKIEKLEELIAHPGTEDTIRSVARNRLALIQRNLPVQPQQRITVPVNVQEEDLDKPFIQGVSLGDLYDGLTHLEPAPNRIQFSRQGQIQMMVPPPFCGKTKPQYMGEINKVCRGAQRIESKMVEGQGYFFVISYV